MLRKLLNLFRSDTPEPTSNPASDKDDAPDFPYELIAVPGKDAESRLNALRDEWRGQFTPVVIGDESELERIAEGVAANRGKVGQDLQQAAHYDLAELFTGTWSEDGKEFAYNQLGEAQPPQPHCSFTFAWDFVHKTHFDRIYIAKIPTANAWEVPAYLSFGAWNECPWPAEHVALHKYWYEKYGAEIVYVSSDTIECTVARPPETPEAALELALEQVQYCEDIVAQGALTIQRLASGLINGTSWFFWWD